MLVSPEDGAGRGNRNCGLHCDARADRFAHASVAHDAQRFVNASAAGLNALGSAAEDMDPRHWNAERMVSLAREAGTRRVFGQTHRVRI